MFCAGGHQVKALYSLLNSGAGSLARDPAVTEMIDRLSEYVTKVFVTSVMESLILSNYRTIIKRHDLVNPILNSSLRHITVSIRIIDTVESPGSIITWEVSVMNTVSYCCTFVPEIFKDPSKT